MTTRLLAVTFDTGDPAAVADFWARTLDRDVVETSRGPLLPGTEVQVGLRFAPTNADKVGPNRMHLHLTSASEADQSSVVARALERGASHLDAGQRPEEGHVVLADPGGNEFCVIPPDSSYLAGCGLLGEVACDGTREVGLFWSAALEWPLVWDQDEETAIQSPAGGTKVGWGGPPVAPLVATTRQRFELVVDRDLSAETERLLTIGAARPDDDRWAEHDVVRLLDPDGNEFWLTESVG